MVTVEWVCREKWGKSRNFVNVVGGVPGRVVSHRMLSIDGQICQRRLILSCNSLGNVVEEQSFLCSYLRGMLMHLVQPMVTVSVATLHRSRTFLVSVVLLLFCSLSLCVILIYAVV